MLTSVIEVIETSGDAVETKRDNFMLFDDKNGLFKQFGLWDCRCD